MLTYVGPAPPERTVLSKLRLPIRAIDCKRADGALLVLTHAIGLVRGIEPGARGIDRKTARTRAHLDDPCGVMAPVERSTRKMWMPRPLPGGRSTCVGSVSRSGELKVPT